MLVLQVCLGGFLRLKVISNDISMFNFTNNEGTEVIQSQINAASRE